MSYSKLSSIIGFIFGWSIVLSLTGSSIIYLSTPSTVTIRDTVPVYFTHDYPQVDIEGTASGVYMQMYKIDSLNERYSSCGTMYWDAYHSNDSVYTMEYQYISR